MVCQDEVILLSCVQQIICHFNLQRRWSGFFTSWLFMFTTEALCIEMFSSLLNNFRYNFMLHFRWVLSYCNFWSSGSASPVCGLCCFYDVGVLTSLSCLETVTLVLLWNWVNNAGFLSICFITALTQSSSMFILFQFGLFCNCYIVWTDLQDILLGWLQCPNHTDGLLLLLLLLRKLRSGRLV